MALDTFDYPRTLQPLDPASLSRRFASLAAAVAGLLTAYQRYQDQRTLESMPHDLRKDMGYRTITPAQNHGVAE